MKQFIFFVSILLLLPVFQVSSDGLVIGPEDLRIEQSLEGGYNLWIRNKPGLESVLLTESTEDPERKAATYALRAPEYNPHNGDEKRMLDGEFLDPEKKLFSLIDSTPESYEAFGSAFRIFIPYIVIYGYEWTRSGEMLVVDGTYLSVRAFGAKYADYGSGFRDNPFILRVAQKPLEGPPEGNYMDDTVKTYTEIAEEGGGRVIYCRGEDDLLNALDEVLDEVDSGSLDLVLALDTTASMENDIPWLKRELVPLLKEQTEGYGHFRFGMVLYRDYHEDYLTRVRPFQKTLDGIQGVINRTTVFGGRDIPEAVYEALYEGVHAFPWMATDRKLLLIGDAPPHERPRGRVTEDMVYEDAEAIGVEITTIILPQ
ncbi:MAG: VWA domain-containing protein [Spirochaetales bacterium]|uniref:VWA domain-containing protein n=1 Tax=Candidatus Thalassospirochaeta sargassi TaxID=3119039 RepID=A0AAJ1MKQ6_9SPIO|nr:VWA domain-containing protein [Spirochaetales bacterium]